MFLQLSLLLLLIQNLCTASEDFCRIALLVCQKTIDSLVSLGILHQQILVNILLEILDFRAVGVKLVAEVLRAKLYLLETPLNMTQIHFFYV